MHKSGLYGTVKMVAQPVEQNRLMVRLENIADKGSPNSSVGLKTIMINMWKDANS